MRFCVHGNNMGKYQGTLSGTFIWGGEIVWVKGDWSTFYFMYFCIFLKLFLNKESKKESPGK